MKEKGKVTVQTRYDLWAIKITVSSMGTQDKHMPSPGKAAPLYSLLILEGSK